VADVLLLDVCYGLVTISVLRWKRICYIKISPSLSPPFLMCLPIGLLASPVPERLGQMSSVPESHSGGLDASFHREFPRNSIRTLPPPYFLYQHKFSGNWI
jgi:hypothetical protein